MANNDRATLQTRLKQLQAATNVVLMAIPRGVAFSVRVDEQMLPKVACVYNSDLRSVLNIVVTILSDGILEYHKDKKEAFEIRIGIFFKNGKDTVQEFYFEDWGGNYNVRGASGEDRLLAKADLPDRIRALLTHQGVVLIRDRDSPCPRF